MPREVKYHIPPCTVSLGNRHEQVRLEVGGEGGLWEGTNKDPDCVFCLEVVTDILGVSSSGCRIGKCQGRGALDV